MEFFTLSFLILFINPFMPTVPTFAVRETTSLGQQMLNATVDINGLMEMSLLLTFPGRVSSHVSSFSSDVSNFTFFFSRFQFFFLTFPVLFLTFQDFFLTFPFFF